MNTLEDKQCLCNLESEWDACVQDALNDVGESITTNLQCRANTRVDSADMISALTLPYHGALRKQDVESVVRDALRKCERDLSDVIHTNGGGRHKFPTPNLQIPPDKVIWRLALIPDVIALIVLWEFDCFEDILGIMGGGRLGCLFGLYALVKTIIILWVLSKLHKIIVRNSIARQAENTSQQVVAHLSKKINLLKKELLRDPDLATK